MNLNYHVLCVIIWQFQNVLAQTQIPTTLIKVANMLKMQQGLGWPHNLTVTVGHEAHMSLTKSVDNEVSCTVSTPFGLSFNVNSPPNNRYQRWSEGCGVKVSNIAETDEGRWKLTSARDGYSLTGWTQVRVIRAPESFTAPEIQLQDGETNTSVLLTSLDNNYCLVAQPFSESSLIPGQCNVNLDRTTRAVQGSWNVLLGVPGRVQELSVQRQVVVQTERLDVGYNHDTAANKLHLYCNIQHTRKNITFCRFQRTDAPIGFNLADGLSDGSHSYYGDGFLVKECGVTVESPTPQDFSTWRCSVGVKMWVGNHVVEQPPMQALVSVAPPSGTYGFLRRFFNDENGEKTLIVENGRIFTIMCRANVSLAYCWFQHPNGTQLTPAKLNDEEQLFWYTGESLQTGDCGVTFSHATREEDGQWTCHMGPRNEKGLEIIDKVNLRVTGPLAAKHKEIRASIGDETTLLCQTSNGNRPLQYCRFLSPRWIGLNVDNSITKENPVMGRYYFTPGYHIDFGDCSLTISAVQSEDIGVWTCAALIDEDATESRDTVVVKRGSGVISEAGVIGMSTGLGFLVILITAVTVYLWQKRRRSRQPAALAASNRPSSENEIISMHSINSQESIGRPSIGSNSTSSGESVFSVLQRKPSKRFAAPDAQIEELRPRQASASLSQSLPSVAKRPSQRSEVISSRAASVALSQRIPSASERSSIVLSLKELELPRPRATGISKTESVSSVL